MSEKNYDFKVIYFPNGSVELRLYNQPICELTPFEKERRFKKKSDTIKARSIESLCDYEYAYVPFEDREIKVFSIEDSDTFERFEVLRKKKNARDSHRRTVNTIHDIARCEKWTKFYTLTFSPSVVDRQDFNACMKKARTWFNNLKKRYAEDLKYLIVPELHADKKSWHIHGLVCNDVGVKYVDSGKRDKKGRVIYNIDNWRFGFSTATDIEDTYKASSYILKYITKELCEMSLGQRRYYRSNNLQTPCVIKELSSDLFNGYWHDDDNLNTLLNSIGIEGDIRKKKVFTEHCSVTYINAIIEEREEKENEN